MFCDREAGKIYYWPRNGETPGNVNAVIPILETLVNIAGDLDNPVNNVEFHGIVF